MREDCSTTELLTHLVPGQGLEPCIFLFVGEVASPAALTGHYSSGITSNTNTIRGSGELLGMPR